MSKASCSSCHGVYDARSMSICPTCSGYVCSSCASDSGACPSCQEDAQSDSY